MRLIAIVSLSLVLFGSNVDAADKPRQRGAAESRTQNLDRYKLGGFGANATATLGVEVNFPTNVPQGATVATFKVDSPAKKAGLQLNDWILEVDGSPVGVIRGRYYELWPHYGRSGDATTEVLVSFLNDIGERRYYYAPVTTAKVTGSAPVERRLPADFFTASKPVERDKAETRDKNFARYVLGYGNFEKYARFELGVTVDYSYESGATIGTIKLGGPAATAGLQVGDSILEVGGAPVGQLGDRLYEVWRQYVYDDDGVVEFLICFTDDATGEFRYYYPEIKLSSKTTEN